MGRKTAFWGGRFLSQVTSFIVQPFLPCPPVVIVLIKHGRGWGVMTATSAPRTPFFHLFLLAPSGGTHWPSLTGKPRALNSSVAERTACSLLNQHRVSPRPGWREGPGPVTLAAASPSTGRWAENLTAREAHLRAAPPWGPRAWTGHPPFPV